MNIKYFYEFKGQDNILNRVEILTDKTVVAQEITVSYTPFLLEYSEVKKLTPIQGSGATLNLISKTIFQFENLHTDNMQEYLVKFYRGGLLYWIGWLDPELYEENLALYPPYPVEFTAADFNVLERLKFTDSFDKNYTDIAPFITQLKRCFDKLSLPFNKLYIGCTTVAEGVSLSSNETLFHKLYIQSTNFYDEDNKPMSCKEVIESILQPFGLIMVQRDASVYIYDYNTIVLNLKMKVYDFNTLTYLSEESVSFILGDMAEIGFRSSNSPYGFEDLINNVSITSSLYADKELFNHSISEKTLSEKKDNVITGDKYKIEYYAKDTDVEALNNTDFVVYTNTDNDATMIGLSLPYTPTPSDQKILSRIKVENKYIIGDANYYINISVKAYVNTRKNPFNTEEIAPGDTSRAKVLWLICNLYFTDEQGKPVLYYNNIGFLPGWWPVGQSEIVPNGGFELFFSPTVDTWNGDPLNVWMTNSDMKLRTAIGQGYPPILQEKNFGVGQNVQLTSAVNGYLVFEILNEGKVDHPGGQGYPYLEAKNILVNDISVSVKDHNKENVSTDDYEFRSYINKNVVTDLEELTLKCISANEIKLPIGKANVLRKMDNHYELQLSFTRSEQTDILERLLLCTIHSNYTRKNKKFTVDIKTTDNPAMRYSTLKNRWPDDKFLTSGCRIDFNQAITNLTVYNFSEDTDKLSDIPYE